MIDETNNNSFTIYELLKLIKSFVLFSLKKYVVLACTIVFGFALGLGYYFVQAPKYIGDASFVLQEKSSSSLGSFAGLASQLGLDITGANSGGSLFAGENILEILLSKKMVYKALLSDVKDNNNNTVKLIDDYLITSKMKNRWKGKEGLENINFIKVSDADSVSPMQDSVLQLVYKYVVKNMLVERTSKKTTVINVKINSKSRTFSKNYPIKLINEAAIFYINVKTTLIRKNVEKLEKRTDSILSLLNTKSYQSADLKVTDYNPGFKTATIPSELAGRDKVVLTTLYGEAIKNLEIAKITLLQETPIIQIIDVPGKTIFDNKSRKLYCVTVGVFTCAFFSFMYLLFSFLKNQQAFKRSSFN